MNHSALVHRTSAIAREALASRSVSWISRLCACQASPQKYTRRELQRTISYNAKLPIAPGLTGLEDSKAGKIPTTIPQNNSQIPRKPTIAGEDVLLRLDRFLKDAQKGPLQTEILPAEAQVIEFLEACRKIGAFFRDVKDRPALTTIKPDARKIVAMLFPNDEHIINHRQRLSPVEIGNIASAIADKAFDRISIAVNTIVENKNILMVPNILREVVEILSIIERPETLARIFVLYSTKDLPEIRRGRVEYQESNPDAISAAVPLETAQVALDAGVRAQNLPLCLDIIDTAVCTKAYKRRKIAQKAVTPAAAIGLTPIGSYIIASQVAAMQDAMSISAMTVVGTIGIVTYLASTGMIGFIASATANDQMERVTWASGMPLRQRWLREDERAFMDRVACAWGFRDPNRRGEEEGQDWEALKELCGIRGMVLDRVELMEGMQ